VRQIVQNDRFLIKLIETGTETAAGRTIYHGFFRFISRIGYTVNAANNPSILHVEAGRMVGAQRIINFPIHISQRGDDPSDWYDGGYQNVCFCDEDSEDPCPNPNCPNRFDD
jgi:hypothetical protein